MTTERDDIYYEDRGHPDYDRGFDFREVGEAAKRLALLCELCEQVQNVPGGGKMQNLALSLAARIAFHLGHQLRSQEAQTPLPGSAVAEGPDLQSQVPQES
jgi:hypothetical protein